MVAKKVPLQEIDEQDILIHKAVLIMTLHSPVNAHPDRYNTP
jgi:hypothetical protein